MKTSKISKIRISATGLITSLLMVATGSLAAGPPPEDRTYFVVTVGLDGPYSLQAECLSFSDAALCSLDGQICGTWERKEIEGRRSSIEFGLLDMNGPSERLLEGRAWIESKGKLSSIGATGRVSISKTVSNFSFSGRQTAAGRCLDLKSDFEVGTSSTVEGSGQTETEERDVSDFERVVVSGVSKLVIDQTGAESLSITAESNVLPLLRSEVVDGQLILGPRPGVSISSTRPIVYRLSVASLTGLTVSGVTNVEIDRLQSDVFDLNLSGVSLVRASGTVNRQNLKVAGTSIYKARDLRSQIAQIDIAGLGTGEIRVDRELRGVISGFGRVSYLGNPTVDVTILGLGELKRIGD